MAKKQKRTREQELTRLIREQKKDMRSSRTVVQYKGRSNELHPNYKLGDDKKMAIALEKFILHNKDS